MARHDPAHEAMIQKREEQTWGWQRDDETEDKPEPENFESEEDDDA